MLIGAMNPMGERLARGVLCGAVGTGVLSLFERLERRLLGATPVYAAESIARRWNLQRSRGSWLRWPYGLAVGMVASALHGPPRRSVVGSGVVVGLAIWACEVVALPALGATPPLQQWSRAERWLLTLHTTAFGLGASVTTRLLARWRRSPEPRQAVP